MIRNFLLWLLLVATACTARTQPVVIVPQPVSLVVNKGFFNINKNTVLMVSDEGDQAAANFLNLYLQQHYGFQLKIGKTERENGIHLNTRKFIQAPGKDAYRLQVESSGVRIEGDNYASTFYGMQTLLQLLPLPDKKENKESLLIPLVQVEDAPRFAYRGMHLDVSRHLFPVSFIKQYIDYLALHKMNYFHWHLTDDQGWRIPISKWQKLTEVGAFRNGTIIGRYPGTGNDNTPYGGFYTKDEIKEIVQYALDRYITVVPEIEMPGHASAAIASYPFLSCFPNQKTEIPGPASEKSKRAGGKLVQETWGVFDDVFCAGSDSTFLFLQDVLDEVLELFPSKFIHVGGDESPKTHWEKCAKCQQRIKVEGLKDEHELQSYFIQRMEKYLNSKGRTLIGWDEILEGGLAPNAVVMSWRGEAGGIAAAKEAHHVIMTPGSHVYFDHTQSQFEDSVTIGGYTPIDKVYIYEPVPKELDSAQARFVLGAQANVWTEYIKHPRKVEYMVFPRMSALSEMLWSPKEARNWESFEKKLPLLYQRYRLWGANYSTAYYDLQATLQPAKDYKGVLLQLQTKDKEGKLTYGVTKRHFQKIYTGPVLFTESGEVVALYTNQSGLTDTIVFNLHFNKATGKKVVLLNQPSRSYPGDGGFTLVNGVRNQHGLARRGEFLGFNSSDLELTIDLGTVQNMTKAIAHSLESEGSWIYAPAGMSVATSIDGKSFKTRPGKLVWSNGAGGKLHLEITFAPVQAQYVKMVVNRLATIPEGKPGAGSAAWLFVDEIELH